MAYSDEDIFSTVSKVKRMMGHFDTNGEFVQKYKKLCPYPAISTLVKRFGSIKNLLQRTLDWEYDNLDVGIMTTGTYMSEGGGGKMQIEAKCDHFIINIYSDKANFTFRIPRMRV